MDSCNDTATGLIISLIEDNADLVDTSAMTPNMLHAYSVCEIFYIPAIYTRWKNNRPLNVFQKTKVVRVSVITQFSKRFHSHLTAQSSDHNHPLHGQEVAFEETPRVAMDRWG